MTKVPSGEASSTTTTSIETPSDAMADAMAAPTKSAAFQAGMITETSMVVTRSDVMAGRARRQAAGWRAA